MRLFVLFEYTEEWCIITIYVVLLIVFLEINEHELAQYK